MRTTEECRQSPGTVDSARQLCGGWPPQHLWTELVSWSSGLPLSVVRVAVVVGELVLGPTRREFAVVAAEGLTVALRGHRWIL